MLCYINSQRVVLNLRDFTASRGGDESTKIRGDGPCIAGDLPMIFFDLTGIERLECDQMINDDLVVSFFTLW